MLRVYGEVIDVIKSLSCALAAIEKRDADLARQLRRASASVALNIAEANGSRGRNRDARFSTALGSMRETLACLQVSEALGYIEGHAEMTKRIDRICAALYSLAR